MRSLVLRRPTVAKEMLNTIVLAVQTACTVDKGIESSGRRNIDTAVHVKCLLRIDCGLQVIRQFLKQRNVLSDPAGTDMHGPKARIDRHHHCFRAVTH